MNCVICKGQNILKREVEESIKIGNDVAIVSIEALICDQCGERYYDRATIRRLENLEQDIVNHRLKLKEIGHILKAA